MHGHPTHIAIPPTGYRVFPYDFAGQVDGMKILNLLDANKQPIRVLALPINCLTVGTPTEAKSLILQWLASGENEIIPVFVASAQAAVSEGRGVDDGRIGQLQKMVELRFRPKLDKMTPPEPESKPEPAPQQPAPIKFKPLF